METTFFTQTITLSPEDNKHLLNLCGQFDEHIHLIEERFDVRIKRRGYTFSVYGKNTKVREVCRSLVDLYQEAKKQAVMIPHQIHLYLKDNNPMELHLKRGAITARGKNQIHYLQHILNTDISFGVGPAGTGKTYLAVACAVHALETARVSRIILVRPIVEAGEKLGFLPGDLADKVHPYLRPLYDALYEMLGIDVVNSYLERNIIELAPLAYMRGRTLNDSFVILDEGQNTTVEQMKMFLTRIGFNSKAVITGDVTQIDLASSRESGLVHALNVLKAVKGISFTQFIASDVVRHPLVQSIVEAYEQYTQKQTKDK